MGEIRRQVLGFAASNANVDKLVIPVSGIPMIRTLAVAAVLLACSMPAHAQVKILMLGDHGGEFQSAGGQNCNRDMVVKQGLGINASMSDIATVLDRAQDARILTRIQKDAYNKRLDAIRGDFAKAKADDHKPTFEQLDWTARQLAALADDINRKLNINQPMLAVNPEYLNEQYEALRTRVSGALNIGRLDGGEAKFYRTEAKRIVGAVDKNDEDSVASASRELSRLTSKLQIATARVKTQQATNATSSSYLLGPRAF
jgi:hypothetical protein